MRGFQATNPIWTAFAISLALTAPTTLQAQVVQLPSTRSLSYSGSVWVPDGGGVDLGGVSTAYSSRGRRGASYAVGSDLSGSSLSASIQIIDLAALDEAILGSVPNTPGTAAPATTAPASAEPVPAVDSASSASPARVNPRPATDLSEPISPQMGIDPGKYLRVLSGQGNQADRPPSQRENDIRYYVEQGQRAENAGRVVAARVFYRMARDLMPPELIERYERIVTQRREAEEARIKAEVEAVRRKF